jgi:hypothetical protein
MTSTQHTDTDDRLMALIRTADPLGDDQPMAAADAEAILAEILDVPRPVAPVRRVPRGTVVLRVAVLGGVAAVVAAGAILVRGDDRGGIEPASAAVIEHAQAGLAQPPGSILHIDVRGTQTNGDGTTVSWRDESWQQNGPPYDRRQVETNPGGTVVESGTVGGDSQVYDPSRNTIYSSAPVADLHREYWISAGPRPGTYTLRGAVFRMTPQHTFKVTPGGPRETIVISAERRQALKDGSSVLHWVRNHSGNGPRWHLAVVSASRARETAPRCAEPDAGSSDFRRQMLMLLRSCGAHVDGHAAIDGRHALVIRFRGGHITYYVDPTTYRPIGIDTAGTDGGTRLRFDVYEVLPGTDGNEELLSLSAQHPSAAVDRSRADYEAAELRMFPHG